LEITFGGHQQIGYQRRMAGGPMTRRLALWRPSCRMSPAGRPGWRFHPQNKNQLPIEWICSIGEYSKPMRKPECM
jgi:hypothetical protein